MPVARTTQRAQDERLYITSPAAKTSAENYALLVGAGRTAVGSQLICIIFSITHLNDMNISQIITKTFVYS